MPPGGELEVLDGKRTFTANAGSVFYIPKGTLHAWRKATTEPARALLLLTPAGFEGVIEEVGVPGHSRLRHRLRHWRACRG